MKHTTETPFLLLDYFCRVAKMCPLTVRDLMVSISPFLTFCSHVMFVIISPQNFLLCSDKKSMLSRARALSSIQFAGGGSGVPGESLPIGQATFVVSFTGGLGENEGMRATVGGSLVPEDHPRAQVC
jgi:hypothetical protein